MIFRILALLLIPSLALAVDKSVEVQWGYTPPSTPAVSGFQLYQEGVKLSQCYFPGALATSGTCTVSLFKFPATFTLTAKFADNTESPHSAPFAFTPIPVINSITPTY